MTCRLKQSCNQARDVRRGAEVTVTGVKMIPQKPETGLETWRNFTRPR